MADDYQEQIDKLKDRVSSLEQLIGLESYTIVLLATKIPHQSLLKRICGDYSKLVKEVLDHGQRIKKMRVSPEKYPDLTNFIKDLKEAVEQEQGKT